LGGSNPPLAPFLNILILFAAVFLHQAASQFHCGADGILVISWGANSHVYCSLAPNSQWDQPNVNAKKNKKCHRQAGERGL